MDLAQLHSVVLNVRCGVRAFHHMLAWRGFRAVAEKHFGPPMITEMDGFDGDPMTIGDTIAVASPDPKEPDPDLAEAQELERLLSESE